MPFLTQNEARVAFVNHILSNMPTGFAVENCLFPNSPSDNDKGQPYLDIKFNFLRSTTITAGIPALMRTPGFVEIIINVPNGQGDNLTGQAVDHLLTLFVNNIEFRNLGFKFQGSSVEPLDDTDNSGVYSESVNIFFYIEGN